MSTEAPGWAKAGDAELDGGHRFICEGQAPNEQDALAAANGICDDKICKLCGVEIESVVQTKETLGGVELERRVVERCRRVRKADTAPQRKLVDCGPGGCTAWVQIFYGKEDQESECARFGNENFADPAACQNTIEAFKNVAGHSAASFRKRVRLIDDAIFQCAQMDVRPTPLMQSLGKKLEVGMGAFCVGAPRYLAGYWLADYPPMWQAYEESDRFVERLQLLRTFLAHKVLLMDVIEASTLDAEQQDTDAAMAHLLEVMAKVAPDEAFGTAHVHMFALDRLAQMHRAGHLTADTAAINTFIREAYPPQSVREWGEFMAVMALFRFDGRVDEAEWTWARGLPNWKRAASELLECRDPGGAAVRKARFHTALDAALSEAKPNERFRAFKAVICWTSCPELVLDVESDLPEDIRAGYDWEFLYDVFHRTEDRMSKALFDRFAARLVRALAVEKADSRRCAALAARFEKLDALEVATEHLDDLTCRCLEVMSNETTKSLVNKSQLYERALDRNLRCVRPAS